LLALQTRRFSSASAAFRDASDFRAASQVFRVYTHVGLAGQIRECVCATVQVCAQWQSMST